MKGWDSTLEAHYQQEVTTVADCWKITRKDGTVKAFTSHQRDLTVGGVTYSAGTSITPSEANANTDLAVDTMEIQTWLAAAGIARADIEAGLYDEAEVLNFELDYNTPAGDTNTKLKGFVGNITWRDEGEVIFEVRSFTQKLQQKLTEKTQPTCWNEFGDEWCQVDLEALKDAGTVTSVTDRQSFDDNANGQASGYYRGGLLEFTSGDNNGYSREIRSWDGTTFEMLEPFPFDVDVGDAYEARPTCFKRLLQDCRDTYDNVDNFRGAPYLPGTDRLYDYPDPK